MLKVLSKLEHCEQDWRFSGVGDHIISFLDICAMRGQLVLAKAPSIPAIDIKPCIVPELTSAGRTVASSLTARSTVRFFL